MRHITLILMISLSCILSGLVGCSVFRGTGRAVTSVGKGTATVVEGVGEGVGQALEGTGRAVSNAATETENEIKK